MSLVSGPYAVTVAEGKRDAVTVEPGQGTAPIIGSASLHEVKAPAADAPRRANGSRTAGFVLGGVGIAGLGASAATGVLAIMYKNAVAQQCPVPKQCTLDGVAIESSGKAFAAASTVAFAVGLSALSVGTYLVLSNRDRPTTTATFAPLLFPAGAGLATSGHF